MSKYADIIRDELNVKSVNFVSDIATVADAFVYLITPKIGARLGSSLKEIIPMVKRGEYKIDGDKLIAGNYTLNSDEFENRLTVKDGISGAALSDSTAVIVLDTNITPELVVEGLANDALRFIQDSRKAADLDVSDRIHMVYNGDDDILNAINTYRERIMNDALIVELTTGDASQFETEIEGHKFAVQITKA
jgi:isoleucyl-tRNA synthetase